MTTFTTSDCFKGSNKRFSLSIYSVGPNVQRNFQSLLPSSLVYFRKGFLGKNVLKRFQSKKAEKSGNLTNTYLLNYLNLCKSEISCLAPLRY